MLIIIGILLIVFITLLIIFRSKYSSSDLIQISIFVILTCSVIIFGIQTHIMNKNYELTQRAWLGPSEPVAVLRYDTEETSLKLDIWVKNFGKLPAKNITIDRYLFIGDQKVWERLADEISLVFPTNTFHAIIRIPLDKYKEKNNINKDARVKQNIQYEGLKGEMYKTEYVTKLRYPYIKLYLEFRKLKESDPTNPRVEKLLNIIKRRPTVTIESGADII